MNFGRMIATAGGAATIAGMVALSGPAAWAQDATPEATEVMAPRPAHIHVGNCNEIGEIVAPLNDLTGAPAGDNLGQRRAIPAETSFTSVPLTLDTILAGDHAINVHLSADEIETYIACGEIGGSLTPEGALIIGLREMNDSGFTGIAYLAPGVDGASTDVSAFIAPNVGGGRNRGGGAEETPTTEGTTGTDDAATTDEAATTDDAATDETATDDTLEEDDNTLVEDDTTLEEDDNALVEDDITIGTPEANQ